jgi:hypothetical protein
MVFGLIRKKFLFQKKNTETIILSFLMMVTDYILHLSGLLINQIRRIIKDEFGMLRKIKTGGVSQNSSMEQPVPKSGSEMFFTFSFDRDGNYYSMDGREIFCARYENGKYLPPEKLSNNINTGELIGAPYISPDGTFTDIL